MTVWQDNSFSLVACTLLRKPDHLAYNLSQHSAGSCHYLRRYAPLVPQSLIIMRSNLTPVCDVLCATLGWQISTHLLRLFQRHHSPRQTQMQLVYLVIFASSHADTCMFFYYTEKKLIWYDGQFDEIPYQFGLDTAHISLICSKW